VLAGPLHKGLLQVWCERDIHSLFYLSTFSASSLIVLLYSENALGYKIDRPRDACDHRSGIVYLRAVASAQVA
jgi:hypothetical protein